MHPKLSPNFPIGHTLVNPALRSAGFGVLLFIAGAFNASAANLPATPGEADIVFHVTDFGINQWHENYRSGADFSAVAGGKTPNRVHTDLCNGGTCDSQILLVMPDNARLKKMTHQQLKSELKAQLQQKVDLAIRGNTKEFEIQLVQNINTRGNFDQKQQALVADFGRAAYEAIGEVRQNIVDRKGLSVYTDATAGSNGTVMLTKTIASWSHYIQAIDLVDGRADMQPTIDTIDAVIKLTGKNNVRIFTAMGDHLAANRPMALLLRVPLKGIDIFTDTLSILPGMKGVKDRLGWKPHMAIGNAHIVAEIMRKRPGTEAFYIERLDLKEVPLVKQFKYAGKQLPGTGHVASMNGKVLGNSSFKASRILPKEKWGFDISAPVTVSYQQMRDPFRFSTSSLQVLTASKKPAVGPPPSVKLTSPTVNRGGVLMNIEPQPVEADIQALREGILEATNGMSTEREVSTAQPRR